VFSDDDCVSLLLEVAPARSLAELLSTLGRLPESAARSYARQMAEALSYCHRMSVLYITLRPEAVLLVGDGTLKLLTPGAPDDRPERMDKGMLIWQAPERVTDTVARSPAWDVWSLGCVVLCMLAGELPWAKLSLMQFLMGVSGACRRRAVAAVRSTILELQQERAKSRTVCLTALVRKRAISLLSACEGEPRARNGGRVCECNRFSLALLCRRERSERLPAEDLLKHPWLSGAPTVTDEKDLQLHQAAAGPTAPADHRGSGPASHAAPAAEAHPADAPTAAPAPHAADASAAGPADPEHDYGSYYATVPASDAAPIAATAPPAAVLSAGSELVSPTRRYIIGRVLGRGAFKVAYQVLDAESGAMSVAAVAQRADDTSAAAEADILRTLDHPCLIRQVEVFVLPGGALVMVTQFMENGALDALASRFGRLSTSLLALYLRQLLEALRYLHGRGVIHCDVKPDNILCAKDGRVVLADFGLAQVVGVGDNTLPVAHLRFADPEAWSDARGRFEMRPACDVYSAGLVAVELATGKPVFGTVNRAELSAMKRARAVPPEAAELLRELGPDDALGAVVEAALRPQSTRPTAAELLDFALFGDGAAKK
jgi:serine/threonine protein kinase